MVRVTPSDLVSFLSSGWGGHVSDKQVTLQYGFLKTLNCSDLVLADRSFNLHDKIALAGPVLIPCFTKGKSVILIRGGYIKTTS